MAPFILFGYNFLWLEITILDSKVTRHRRIECGSLIVELQMQHTLITRNLFRSPIMTIFPLLRLLKVRYFLLMMNLEKTTCFNISNYFDNIQKNNKYMLLHINENSKIHLVTNSYTSIQKVKGIPSTNLCRGKQNETFPSSISCHNNFHTTSLFFLT